MLSNEHRLRYWPPLVMVVFLFSSVAHSGEPTSFSQPYLWYSVKAGETISKILAKFALCAPGKDSCDRVKEEVVRLNPVEVRLGGKMIWEGAQLVLPVRELPKGVPFTLTGRHEIIAATPLPRSMPVTPARKVTSSNEPQQPQYVPVPERVPSLIHVEESTPSHQEIKVAPFFSYSTLIASDPINEGHSSLASNPILGILIEYSHSLRGKFDLFGQAEAQSVSFPSQVGTQTLNVNKQLYIGALAGIRWNATQTFSLSLGAGVIQLPIFYSSTSSAALSLGQATVPEGLLLAHYRIYSGKSLAISAEGAVGALVPASGSEKLATLGVDFRGALTIEKDWTQGWKILFQPYLRRQSLKTAIISENIQDLGMALGLEKRF